MRSSTNNPKPPSIPLGGHVFFAPLSWSHPRHSLSMHRTYRYGHSISYSNFQTDGHDLLLSQSPSGELYWLYTENLLKKDEDMILHPCSMEMDEAAKVAQDRTLYISVSDPRLSDCELLGFSILANKYGKGSGGNKMPTFICPKGDGKGDTEVTDLVSTHLALGGAVEIFSRDASGEKYLDEVRTSDYWCVMRDILHDPSATRNLRRVCNCLGPVGEGPTCLGEQVCYSEAGEQGRLGRSSGNSLLGNEVELLSDLVPWRGIVKDACARPGPAKPIVSQAGMEVEENQCSLTYRIMNLAGMGLIKRGQRMLEAEKQKYELKKARRGKKQEEFGEPTGESDSSLKRAAYKFLSCITTLKPEIFVSAPKSVYDKRLCTSLTRKDSGLARAGAEIAGPAREIVAIMEVEDTASIASPRLWSPSPVLDITSTGEECKSSGGTIPAATPRLQRRVHTRQRRSVDCTHPIDEVLPHNSINSWGDGLRPIITTCEMFNLDSGSEAKPQTNQEDNCAVDTEDDLDDKDEDETLRNSLCLRRIKAHCKNPHREHLQTQCHHDHNYAYDADDDYDSTSSNSSQPSDWISSPISSFSLPTTNTG